MSAKAGLFTELRRRNVFRVGAAYVVVGWLLVQASDIVFPRLGLPEWTVTFVILLVALGLPLALFLAWAYELTPEGVRRSAEVHPAESIRPQTGRRLDWLILVGLALVIVVVVADRVWFAPGPMPADASAQQQDEVVDPERAPEDTQRVTDRSIAVLPFADMSPDKDQEYFGDGLAEEILNLLAQIQELKVSGRTSSFSFKGKDTPIPEIGELLSVAHVLDGSVRKSGNRVRITAQLVKADDGFHLWSETFDRQLADIFAIQDEIAGAIANALQLRLVGQVAEAGSFEAYDLYLRARTLIYGRTVEGLREARALIDRALALDPDYPPALAASGELWMLLAASPTSYGDIPREEANAAAREALQRALALDPDLADAHAGMGLLFIVLADYDTALAHLERALAVNPSLTNANLWRGLAFAQSGRMLRAVDSGRRFAELDPLFLTNLSNLVGHLGVIGEFGEAEALARRSQRSHPDHSMATFGAVLREQGRLAEAVEYLEGLRAKGDDRALLRLILEKAYYSLGAYARALELSAGFTELQALIGLEREEEGLARVWPRMEASSTEFVATLGILHGLALAGRHRELLDWVAGHWIGPAELDTMVPYHFAQGRTLAPLAAAQRSTGRSAEQAATLEYWGGVLAFLEENGFATGTFAFAQAAAHALSGERGHALQRLGDAIDLGYRDPLLFRSPPFEPWWNDADFRALVARNLDLINTERARLGMEPLP